MIDMTYWCESCARKNNCYTIRSRPKCFVAITNTDRKTEPQADCRRCKWFVTDKCHECFGNELFKDSGYVTQTGREGE